MLDRVVVDVIHMPLEVRLITDDMLPETPLPNRAFFRAQSSGIRRRFGLMTEGSAESTLDESPSHREIRISSRERPDTVEMIGQNDNGVDRKRVRLHHLPERTSQQLHMRRSCQDPCPSVRDNGEKIHASFNAGSQVTLGEIPLFMSCCFLAFFEPVLMQSSNRTLLKLFQILASQALTPVEM